MEFGQGTQKVECHYGVQRLWGLLLSLPVVG